MSDLEESREGLEEGEVPDHEAFTGVRPRGSVFDSDKTSWGRDSWRAARRQEVHEGVEWAEARPWGRGKRRAERGQGSRGAAKQPRVESSSSERRNESEGSMSRSGSARGHHDRGRYHTGRPGPHPIDPGRGD